MKKQSKIPKSNKIFIIIFISIFLLIGFYLFFNTLNFFNNSKIDSDNQIEDIHEEIDNIENLKENQLNALFYDGTFTEEITKCINEGADYEFVALLNDDVRLCERTQNVAGCESNYYLIKSIKINDKSLCENLINFEVEACKNIGNQDVSVCSNLELNEEKIYCNALISNNLDLCDELTDENFNLYCNQLVLTFNALKSDNIEICKNNEDEDFVAFCESYITNNSLIYYEQMEYNCGIY